MKPVFFVLAVLAFGAPAHAKSLLDSVKEGASKVGQAAQKGVEAVDESIKSTDELVRNEATPEETRAKLDAMANEVLIKLLTENANAVSAYAETTGYAVFDMRRVTVFPLSGGYGRGVAVAPDGTRTYMKMGTGGVGVAFGIGGFESQFVIMFETPVDFERFVEDGYDASADTGVMSGDETDKAEVQFTHGQSYFVLSKKGWRVNANASGTKYWKDEELN
ncbi:MAG: hypothetical protein ACSHXD_07330 [Marinosulfonomonas sp.]